MLYIYYADEACRSSENIRPFDYNYSLFVDLQLFLLYFSIFFDVVVLHFRRLFIICVCLHRIVNTCFRSNILQVHTLATFSDVYLYMYIVYMIGTNQQRYHILIHCIRQRGNGVCIKCYFWLSQVCLPNVFKF